MRNVLYQTRGGGTLIGSISNASKSFRVKCNRDLLVVSQFKLRFKTVIVQIVHSHLVHKRPRRQNNIYKTARRTGLSHGTFGYYQG